MLVLSDQSLALLVAAASHVAFNRRRNWLQKAAAALEAGESLPPKPLAPSTLATRRWRKRLHDEKVRLEIVVDEADVCATLVALDCLHVNEADDRKALDRAAVAGLALLRELSRREDNMAIRIRAELLIAMRKATRRDRQL